MEISEQKKQAIQTMSPAQEYLYGDPEAGEKLAEIAERHQINSETAHYTALATAVGDVILGLVPQTKLPDLFTERLGVSRPNALRITADVLDFLAPLATATTPVTPPAAVIPSPVPTPLPVTAQPVATTTPPAPTESTPAVPALDPAEVAAQIAAAEAELAHQVQPLRTMAHDMDNVRSVHTSAPADSVAPVATPMTASIPEPHELITPSTDAANLVADGPGNQTKNPQAAWGNSGTTQTPTS